MSARWLVKSELITKEESLAVPMWKRAGDSGSRASAGNTFIVHAESLLLPGLDNC